jgi:hypothetical protein
MASVSLVSDEVYTAAEEKDRGLSDRDVWFDKVLPGALTAFNTIVDLMTRDEPPIATRPAVGTQISGNGNDQRKTL